MNATKATVVATDTEIASSPWTRFRGLMMRGEFPEGSALVLDPCASIHMFFMRFPIDVLYLDKYDVVVRIQEQFKPWRIGPVRTRGAAYVVELPAGTIHDTGIETGDQIKIQL